MSDLEANPTRTELIELMLVMTFFTVCVCVAYILREFSFIPTAADVASHAKRLYARLNFETL